MPTPTAIDGPSTRLGVIDSPIIEAHIQKVAKAVPAQLIIDSETNLGHSVRNFLSQVPWVVGGGALKRGHQSWKNRTFLQQTDRHFAMSDSQARTMPAWQ